MLYAVILIITTKGRTLELAQRASLTLSTIQKQFYINFRNYFACQTVLSYLCLIQEAFRRGLYLEIKVAEH